MCGKNPPCAGLAPNGLSAFHRSTSRCEGHGRGFTLIELLVVVSIIGLLVGILLPSLGRAREESYRLKDACNLREVQMAWFLYAEDHAGWTFTFEIGHHPQQWSYLLSHYFVNWDIVLPFLGTDPLGIHDVPDWAVAAFMRGEEVWEYMIPLFARAVYPAYGYNHLGWTPEYRPGWEGRLPQSRIKGLQYDSCFRPAEVLVFGTTIGCATGTFDDYGWYRIEPYQELTYPDPGRIMWAGAPPFVQNSYGGLSPRWLGKANISFADGHVVAVDPATLTDVRAWDPQRR